MSRKATTEMPAQPEEPTITYSRNLSLQAEKMGIIKLGHLRALLREADHRGFADDAPVSIYSAASLGFYRDRIDIGGADQ